MAPDRPEAISAEGWFRAQTLSIQFLVASGILIFCATLMAGYFINGIVTSNAIRNKASTTALLVQSLTEPLVQDLASSKALPQAKAASLDELLDGLSFRQRFPHLEIWMPDGTVAYSLSKGLIGRRFDAPPGLKQALEGEVAALYTDLDAGEHTVRNFSTRYLEIYSPLRDQSSGGIIAVAEIHEDTSVFSGNLLRLHVVTWVIVALFSALMLFGLFGIVHRGSRTIEAQRGTLRQRAEEAELVSRELMELRMRAQTASMELAELNERFVRRVGADLHDGPAQLLGYAALQIDAVREAETGAARERPLTALAGAVNEALAEIRTIAKSLVLPEIEHLGAEEIISRVISQHEARTATTVAFEPRGRDAELPPAIKTCLYRFVQEGLNNAYRHAGGNGQRVRCRIDYPLLEVSVRDAGPPTGFKRAPASSSGSGMGIHGLKQRVESLGGRFSIQRQPGGGTRLTMKFDLSGGILFGETDDHRHR
ncbi:MAG: sensor histidine kinase [Shinella sp.]|nr:sensor histidine kinase [Shinella sp.]